MLKNTYNFDDKNREVIIKKFNTPTPWMNYLSNGTFHTMISQAGGGVAFYRSPQIWRINHYRFFHLPTDRSGFYVYIKDGENVFCPTAEPTPCKPDDFEAVHGMGYTKFHSKKGDLKADLRFHIGEMENCLIWEFELCSGTDKKLKIFPFVELGMMEFMRELQWQCYNKHQLFVYRLDDILVYKYGVENQPKSKETPLIYFATNCKTNGFDGDRDEFVGTYRSEENPAAVEEGKCHNSLLAGGDPCFAFEIDVELKANEPKKLCFFLGAAKDDTDVKRAVNHCLEDGFAENSFEKLNKKWDEYFNSFECSLPDENAQRMINIWNPYQSERNFQFSRNISYYATGTFRGVGFRDTAQDILAMIPFDTERAKDKIKLLLTQQYNDGHVNHYFFPTEGWEPVTTIHSDDHLWIVHTVRCLLEEEGKTDFLDEKVAYFDNGDGTVLEHIKKSIDYTVSHMGSHGFPLMLRSDWNDQLFRVCRQGKGESIWTAMQFGVCLKDMIRICELLGLPFDGYERLYEEQSKTVNEKAWDGGWFRRAIMDNGRYLGSKDEPQAKIWLNSQTWSVISGMADDEKARKAMQSVYEMLNTPMGIKKIEPSIENYPSAEDPLTNYSKGCGENGAIFCHANTWAIIAECMLGNADRAYMYYHHLLPMIAQEKAGEWRYKAEPYVYSSNIMGPESLNFGLANVSWLSGTAAWMYIAATQYILGIKANYNGLTVKPCMPEDWQNIRVKRKFRGCVYNITLVPTENEPFIEEDGIKTEGNFISHKEDCNARNINVYYKKANSAKAYS